MRTLSSRYLSASLRLLRFVKFNFVFSGVLTLFFQTSDKENEQRRRLEQAAALAASQKDDLILRNNRVNQKKQQVGSYDMRLSSNFLQNLAQLNFELQQRTQNS